MKDFDRLIELANSKEVAEGVGLPEIQLHKWLVLGQTDYLCEHGTLSDGHEKFTPAQKYAQSLRELYNISLSVKQYEASAMIAKADFIDGEAILAAAGTDSEKLRAKAQILKAQTALLSSLVQVEDATRMLRFYSRASAVLKPIVEQQYPGGIETAEQDNWEAVALYRLEKEKTPGLARERLDHLPLPPERKAVIGYASGRHDAIAPLMIVNPARCEEIARIMSSSHESKKLEQKETN